MTAPTTRETADHAELLASLRASKRDRHGIYGRVLANPDGPRAADVLEALLSEIAALRGYGRDVAKEALEYRRQRDEAVGLLRKATGLKCDDWRGFASFKTNARALLANQGADQ
ncbi:hypothetical protein [Brevundimonas sp.]|uniref:hypothetical protein n=1 Tax=Brevundimonas sp. TaxID=1871086 RepID=UPI002ED9A0AD